MARRSDCRICASLKVAGGNAATPELELRSRLFWLLYQPATWALDYLYDAYARLCRIWSEITFRAFYESFLATAIARNVLRRHVDPIARWRENGRSSRRSLTLAPNERVR
jgi:hypothetical protein